VLTLLELFTGPSTLLGQALSLNGAFPVPKRPTDEMLWNRRDVHAAQLPAANGISNARSLARLYAALLGEVEGVRLVSPATLERARATAVSGPDRCLMVETAFGMGFMTHAAMTPMTGPGSFGHGGAGGSWAFAQPERKLAFAYVMNVLDPNILGDVRAANLINATVACL
jgi:CubicO group peptidase (beta-lactamase class C family)